MDLLVLIVAYKLSRINYFSLNSVETCRFEVTAFGFNFSVIKNRIRYFPLCQKKKKRFIYHCSGLLLFLRRSIFYSSAWLWNQLISFWETFNTTNAMRVSTAMFSWQPLLNFLICWFIYSVRLRSKLNGKKYSHMVLRNRSLITEGDSDHVLLRRKEYM